MKTSRKNLSFIFALSLILTLFVGIVPVQAATAKSGKVVVTVSNTTLYVGDSQNNSTPITVKYNDKKVRSGVKYSTSNKKIATVKKGKLYTFKAYANNTQLKATSVKWTTSNKKIVSVNKKGTIKALKNGKAVITAKTSFGTAKCTVTVSAHQHTWVDHTATKKVPRTVHHDAVYEDVTIPAVTKEQILCSTCSQLFDSIDDITIHQLYETNGKCVGFSAVNVVITPAH